MCVWVRALPKSPLKVPLCESQVTDLRENISCVKFPFLPKRDSNPRPVFISQPPLPLCHRGTFTSATRLRCGYVCVSVLCCVVLCTQSKCSEYFVCWWLCPQLRPSSACTTAFSSHLCWATLPHNSGTQQCHCYEMFPCTEFTCQLWLSLWGDQWGGLGKTITHNNHTLIFLKLGTTKYFLDQRRDLVKKNKLKENQNCVLLCIKSLPGKFSYFVFLKCLSERFTN